MPTKSAYPGCRRVELGWRGTTGATDSETERECLFSTSSKSQTVSVLDGPARGWPVEASSVSPGGLPSPPGRRATRCGSGSGRSPPDLTAVPSVPLSPWEQLSAVRSQGCRPGCHTRLPDTVAGPVTGFGRPARLSRCSSCAGLLYRIALLARPRKLGRPRAGPRCMGSARGSRPERGHPCNPGGRGRRFPVPRKARGFRGSCDGASFLMPSRSSVPREPSALLGGSWRGHSGATLPCATPPTAPSSPRCRRRRHDAVDALDAPRRQQEWGTAPPRDRGEILPAPSSDNRPGRRLRRADEPRDGKTVKEARGEVTYGAEFFRVSAVEAVRIPGAEQARRAAAGCDGQEAGRAVLVHHPPGTSRSMGISARSAGCRGRVHDGRKPAELTPLTMLALGRRGGGRLRPGSQHGHDERLQVASKRVADDRRAR